MGATAAAGAAWFAANAGTISAAAAAAGAATTAGVAISGALKGTPKPPASPLMPDQASIDQAQQLKAAQAATQRNGRASTVLTNNSNTSDLLGP